jgi:hypothetical protein
MDENFLNETPRVGHEQKGRDGEVFDVPTKVRRSFEHWDQLFEEGLS